MSAHAFGRGSLDHGSFEAATRLLGSVRLCTLYVSLGNVDTLVEYPASLTHRMISPGERAESGMIDGLIRVSVGLEDVGNIIADLEWGLAD